MRGANASHAIAHVPALLCCLVWLSRRHGDRYPVVRNVLAISAGACLLVPLLLAISVSPWRWSVLAHPVLTFLVVAATANQWWLDGVVAVALVAAAWGVDRAGRKVVRRMHRVDHGGHDPLGAARSDRPVGAEARPDPVGSERRVPVPATASASAVRQ